MAATEPVRGKDFPDTGIAYHEPLSTRLSSSLATPGSAEEMFTGIPTSLLGKERADVLHDFLDPIMLQCYQDFANDPNGTFHNFIMPTINVELSNYGNALCEALNGHNDDEYCTPDTTLGVTLVRQPFNWSVGTGFEIYSCIPTIVERDTPTVDQYSRVIMSVGESELLRSFDIQLECK